MESKIYSIISLTVCFIAVSNAATSKYAGSRPNIILMFVDDIGWGDIGANWNETVDTPNLDKLAKNGMRFTDFHAAASLCTPSRAALLTGRYGLRTGVIKNFGSCATTGLPLNETTMAETLHNSGYETFMIGKWHLGIGPNEKYHPINRGFQHYVGVPYSVDMGCKDDPGYDLPMENPCPKDETNGVPALPLYNDSQIVAQPADIYHLGNTYVDTFNRLTDKALKTGNPFFAYIPFSHVHTPLAFDEKFKNVSKHGIFGDTLHELDDMIGRMMATVASYGQTENTLVWFTGDNGNWEVKCEYAGEPRTFPRYMAEDIRWRRWYCKTYHLGGRSREPTLAYWPGKIKAGTVSNALLSSMDLFPTFVSLAGAEMPPNRVYDGKDLSSMLFEDGLSSLDGLGHDVLFHHSTITLKFEAVRFKQWKAVYLSGGTAGCASNPAPVKTHNPPLLFDLDADPAETKALDTSLPEYAAIVQHIDELLAAELLNINNDNTTVVNYHQDCKYAPCCNPQHVVCRCENQLVI